MKVTLKYEEADSKDLHMILRLTLPQKYVNGQCREVVKLFVDHYNKKHTEDKLDVEVLHLKIVGGDHLDNEERVRDSFKSGDELYLLPESMRGEKREAYPAAAAAAAAAPAAPQPSASSSSAAPKGAAAKTDCKVVSKDANGRVRCKNFGCQRTFDPDGEPQPCTCHKAAPVFHETAKFWSCCPDRKAYDWDEFMKIPGCTTSVCTSETQGTKRVLGGCDLRGDSAPVRLDADAPPDPRKKLNAVRAGLIAIGVDPALFEKVWGQLEAESGDADKVCERFRSAFSAVLNDKDI